MILWRAENIKGENHEFHLSKDLRWQNRLKTLREWAYTLSRMWTENNKGETHKNKMNPERIISIRELEARAEIIEVDLAVRNYLADHPPTLGHGYSHLKKVARLAYQLAIKNAFNGPEIAYVAGFFHDLYRPAMGEAGQEEHEEITARETEELLKRTSFAKKTKEIELAILNHDEAIQAGKSTPLMEILSIADKTDMSFQRAVCYSWASNRYLREKGKIAYTSFMETMRDFCFFQVKAWKVFLAVDIKGVKQATEAYLQTDEDLIRAVRDELGGKITYQEKSLELARKEAMVEKDYLEKAGADKEEIRKITHNFSELIG